MKRFIILALVATSTLAHAGNGRWVANAKSRGVVRFDVTGPIDDVTGETRTLAGVLDFEPERWPAGSGVVVVPLNTITTGIDERDGDMRAEFLETRRFPNAVLTIDSITAPAAALLAGGHAEGEVKGSFELHGIRRIIGFKMKAKLDDSGTRLEVSGGFPITLADYNIARPQRLFFKLGETAQVTFMVAFKKSEGEPAAQASAAKPTEPELRLAPTVTEVKPAAAKPKAPPVRKPPRKLLVTFQFTGNDAKAKGERLFHAPELGGPDNKLTCFHCHAKTDERSGFVQKDGFVRPADSLYNAGQRASFWNGFAANLGAASAICQKQYMKGEGLTPEQAEQLTAFIDAISPDPAPALDYAITYRSMDSALRDPIGGDVARGKKLADTLCMICHLDGRVAPVWAPGLYEPEWVVRRVRRLDGHQNLQMPNFTITRLPDSDLRDIVTYLTSPKSEAPIFNRQKRVAAGKDTP
jgi:polyisoprenoid-binding protein YceI